MKLKNFFVILFLAITTMVMVSCGSKEPLSEDQLIYAGTWTAPGDLMIKISADGGGDYTMSGSNVSGGSVTFTQNIDTFKIGLFGIEEAFAIDAAPYTEGENTFMTVNGVTYTKSN